MEKEIQQFAKIIDKKLKVSDKPLEGYKLLFYADIPKFDQGTQYIVQSIPIEEKDSIICGIEVREMIIDKEEDGFIAGS